MEKGETHQAVRFGSYEITGAKGQVLQRNHPLALSPKAVAVLWTLVHRPGQVVSKEELFTAVWPETIVSEGVLTSRVREVRQALGDATAKPRYIETVSRRGYRFIAPLTTPLPQGSGARGRGSGREPQNEVKRLPDQALSVPSPGPRPFQG